MNKAYLLTGGNIGNKALNLNRAMNALKRIGTIAAQSPVFETQAWGITDQNPFLNQAVLLYTTCDAESLLRQILSIEEEMGRKRIQKFGARIIDMDILFFNEEIIKENHLTIPHPEVQNRRFALAPLNEIAPDLVHPVLKKSIRELLAECKDKLEVKKI